MQRAQQRRRQGVETPPVDPAAIDRAYRFYRAQRTARTEHRRATKLARFRFLAVALALVLAFLVVAVTVWSEIERLFGL